MLPIRILPEALTLAGVPVIHFVCRAGLARCVLGSNRDDVTNSLPASAALPNPTVFMPVQMCIGSRTVLFPTLNQSWQG